MHLFRAAERGALGREGSRKAKLCENPTGRKEVVKAKKNRLLQVELPLSNPARRSQFRRVGHTQLRAVHCGQHGALGKSPVKAITEREKRRKAWFSKLCLRYSPRSWREHLLEEEWMKVSWVGIGSVEVGDPALLCDGVRLGERYLYSSEYRLEELEITSVKVVVGHDEIKKQKVIRRVRRLFRKFRGGSFLILCPNFGSRGPKGRTIGKIAQQLGMRPNRRVRRFRSRCNGGKGHITSLKKLEDKSPYSGSTGALAGRSGRAGGSASAGTKDGPRVKAGTSGSRGSGRQSVRFGRWF
jgi:hypothetical protein